MNDIWAVLTQPLNLWAYSHVIAGAVLSGATMFAGISAYFLMKRRDVDLFGKSVRLGLVGMSGSSFRHRIPDRRFAGPSGQGDPMGATSGAGVSWIQSTNTCP
jgi:hypothetical protein